MWQISDKIQIQKAPQICKFHKYNMIFWNFFHIQLK